MASRRDSPQHGVFLTSSAKAKVVSVETSGQMFDAVKEHFDKCDCLVMSAAVSDYKPARESKTKLKKGSGDLTIRLKPTKDILKWAGQNKKGQIVAGFALEDKNIRENAQRKLVEKKLDMIIANTPAAIAAEKSVVQIKTADSDWVKLPLATKAATAKKIIRLIETLAV